MTDASHPLHAELEQQLRHNLELRAALDDCRLAASSPPLPLAAWQLPLLQLALSASPAGQSASPASPETLLLPPASQPAGWLARLQLAWVHLGQGEAEAAAALQAELQTQLKATDASGQAGLDLLNRVISSQAWLACSVTPPPAEHSALASAGLRMALDRLSLTPDGLGLGIEGWCIDPAGQLAGLVLLRGSQALPLPLAALQRRARADLAPLLQEQHMAANWPAGFHLALPLPAATAAATAAVGAAAQPVLFVRLHNGEQFCLSRPIHPEPLAWSRLLALSPPWPVP
ncbi:MAG: hypothetical protein VKM92_09305 [Cyanobacteriota bacterium]|nr:hypothetical protein [Cyanobacteriota bacterium]